MRLAALAATLAWSAGTLAWSAGTPAWSAGTPTARAAAPAQAVPVPTPFPTPSAPGAQTPPPKGSGFVLGQVVDGSTGKPVGGVLVTMNMNVQMAAPRGAGAAGVGAAPGAPASASSAAGPAPPPPGVSISTTQRVLTDGEGHFLFHDLPKSSLNFNAQAPGYTSGSFGQRRPNGPSRSLDLADGQRVSDAVIRVWKLASISGTVVDEAGEPLVAVQVQAMRLTLSGGQRRFNISNTTTTDDRGMYHFSLPTGDYVVFVPHTMTAVPASSLDLYQQAINTPGNAGSEFMRDLTNSGAPIPSGSGYRVGTMQIQQNGTLARALPPPGEGRLMTYQTTFYPAATALPQAQIISLGSGEERQAVDVAMRLVGTTTVSGIVTGTDTVGSLGVRLTLAENGDAPFLDAQQPAASTLTDASGAFTFLGVPPGQYILRITKVPRQVFVNFVDGSPAVNFNAGGNSADPTGQTLWAQMPVSVGETEIVGLPVTLRPGVKLSGRVEFDGSAPRPQTQRLAAAQLTANSIDSPGPVSPVRFTPEGTFVTGGLLPGRYLLTASAPGSPWVLQSITLNGHDASAMPVTIDADITGVVLTYTDHPTEVEITVHGDTTGPENQTSVVIFPANYQAWLAAGTQGRASRFTSITPNAPTTIRSLPAGDYLVAAIPTDLQSDWQDPKTLEAIARGASHLLLSDGEHRTIELRPLIIK